jgi:hypothetical protein
VFSLVFTKLDVMAQRLLTDPIGKYFDIDKFAKGFDAYEWFFFYFFLFRFVFVFLFLPPPSSRLSPLFIPFFALLLC